MEGESANFDRMFRYYSWLPVELFPEYREGYTCDGEGCGKDFVSGPFFHEDSGKDICTECAEKAGHSPSEGLVYELMFLSEVPALTDEVSHAMALFAYRVSNKTIGIHFSDDSNVLLDVGATVEGGSPSINSARVIHSRGRVVDVRDAAVAARWPWLARILPTLQNDSVRFFDAGGTSSGSTVVKEYRVTDRFIQLSLSHGVQQLMDSEDSTIFVHRNGSLIAVFRAGAPVRTVRKTALEMYARAKQFMERGDSTSALP